MVKRVVHVARRDQSQQRDEELAGRLHGYRSFLDSLYQDMEERSSGLDGRLAPDAPDALLLLLPQLLLRAM